MIPWIIFALVVVPLVVIAFVAARRRTVAGEGLASESAQGAGVRRGGGLRRGVARAGQGEAPPGAPALIGRRLRDALFPAGALLRRLFLAVLRRRVRHELVQEAGRRRGHGLDRAL